MRAVLAALRVLVLYGLVWAAAGAQGGIPSAPTQWVTDSTGFLSTATAQDLNGRLRSYERRTGHQVLVYVVPASVSPPLEDWTVRVFASWKVGRKALDDGLILFVVPKTRALRIEVGYGLEQVVPDVVAARIIRETIAPGLRQGQPDQAIVAGVDRLLAAIGTAPERAAAPPSVQDAPAALSPLELILIGLVVLGLLLVAVRSPMTALYLLVNIIGRGDGMSGSRGFSGGGGRSGGGGASGRW